MGSASSSKQKSQGTTSSMGGGNTYGYNENQASGYNQGFSQGSSAGGTQGSSYGLSDSSGYGSSQGSGYGTSSGTSMGTSRGTSDVWGAQQPGLQSLYAQAAQLANGQGAAAQGSQQVANQAQNAWLQQLTPGGNPYFERSVQGAIDSATQGFQRNVLPELDARGVAMGQYGGARDNLARGEAAGLFGQGLSQQIGSMYANQYAGDQNRASQALGLAGNIQGMQTAGLQTAANLMGGPTVLSQQEAMNQANSSSMNQNQNTAYNQNQASSINQAQNSGWNSAQNTASNYGQNQSSGWGQNQASTWNNSTGQQTGSGSSASLGILSK